MPEKRDEDRTDGPLTDLPAEREREAGKGDGRGEEERDGETDRSAAEDSAGGDREIL